MAINTNKGIVVTIDHLPDDSKGDILKIGTDLWNALVPTTVREGPIAISVSALRSHIVKSGAVVCSATPSKDVEVSNRLYFLQYTISDLELLSRRCSAFLSTWQSNIPTHLQSIDLAMLERRTWSR
jgi:hypothetical protein